MDGSGASVGAVVPARSDQFTGVLVILRAGKVSRFDSKTVDV